MEERVIVTHLVLNADETLKKVKVKKVVEPNYFRIGNGTMNKNGIQSIDLVRELVNMSKPAQTVLLWIKDGMVWNSYENRIEFVVRIKPETDAQKQMLKKGLKELFAKDLVRRVSMGRYMINPNAIITNYEAQMLEWNRCK